MYPGSPCIGIPAGRARSLGNTYELEYNQLSKRTCAARRNSNARTARVHREKFERGIASSDGKLMCQGVQSFRMLSRPQLAQQSISAGHFGNQTKRTTERVYVLHPLHTRERDIYV